MSALAGAVVLVLWLRTGAPSGQPEKAPQPPPSTHLSEVTASPGGPPGQQEASPPTGKPAEGEHKSPAPGSSFLQAFGDKGAKTEEGNTGSVLTDDALEKQFQALEEIQERAEALEARATEREQLIGQLNKGLAGLEKQMARARQARPNDLVPQWLTGELLMLVGGEPDQILPYLQRAADGGLDRPRLFSSLARVQFEANQFARACDSAVKGLDGACRDRYAWSAYTLATFGVERYADVIERLDRSFPASPPDWAVSVRHEASDLEARWQTELKLRAAEQKADNLPRVRLVIEHRHFTRPAGGGASSGMESTGRGEVVIELFEDQAPATVANFLTLASQGEYDSTRFYLAESAAVVVGGDPNSKKGDPSEDGSGGPGYVIADEFQSPQARGHLRGSVSMVNTGPHTAGSQFFITLVPRPEMNGHFTVFGRIIQGQDVADRITQGRTNLEVGHFGKVIPGDLLVHAEVVRKRPHEYPVVKERPRE